MKLNTPSGFSDYAGADITSEKDATGAIFWSCTARGPDGRFGQYVFKQVNGQATVVPIGEYSGRGELNLWGSGELVLTTWNKGSDDPEYVPVPGFVPFSTGGAATTVPVPGPPGPPGPAGRDGAQGKQGPPGSPAPAVTDEHIAEIAWAKAKDAIADTWNNWVTNYNEHPQLYNVIYNRVLKAAQAWGLPLPGWVHPNAEDTTTL